MYCKTFLVTSALSLNEILGYCVKFKTLKTIVEFKRNFSRISSMSGNPLFVTKKAIG